MDLVVVSEQAAYMRQNSCFASVDLSTLVYMIIDTIRKPCLSVRLHKVKQLAVLWWVWSF